MCILHPFVFFIRSHFLSLFDPGLRNESDVLLVFSANLLEAHEIEIDLLVYEAYLLGSSNYAYSFGIK